MHAVLTFPVRATYLFHINPFPSAISVLHVHIAHVISADFNLDFYTEVQDLSYLENLLSQQSPRYAALNMEICSLIEDFSLVGFETLAVEVRIRILYTLSSSTFRKLCSQDPTSCP